VRDPPDFSYACDRHTPSSRMCTSDGKESPWTVILLVISEITVLARKCCEGCRGLDLRCKSEGGVLENSQNW
jgi:hypothetical protein